jgi:chromosome partitioning protein
MTTFTDWRSAMGDVAVVKAGRVQGVAAAAADDVPSKRTLGGRRRRKARWLLVASAKGGSGKTTTSLNLAVLAANEGLRVLLVDLDAQQTLSWWASQRPREAPRVEVLTKRLRDLSGEDGGLGEIEASVDELGADFVIIDTPPSLDDWPRETLRLIGRADLTLIPTGQGTPDLNSVIEWMATLKRERGKAAFLLNQADRGQISFEKAKVRLNRAGLLCPMDVRRLADIRNAFDHGLGIAEVGGANGGNEFLPVWDFVKNLVGIDL